MDEQTEDLRPAVSRLERELDVMRARAERAEQRVEDKTAEAVNAAGRGDDARAQVRELEEDARRSLEDVLALKAIATDAVTELEAWAPRDADELRARLDAIG